MGAFRLNDGAPRLISFEPLLISARAHGSVCALTQPLLSQSDALRPHCCLHLLPLPPSVPSCVAWLIHQIHFAFLWKRLHLCADAADAVTAADGAAGRVSFDRAVDAAVEAATSLPLIEI